MSNASGSCVWGAVMSRIGPPACDGNRLSPEVKIWLLLAVVAVGVRLVVYAASYYQADDAWITFRYAENIARGAGFVFNPGQRVYGTTTPLLTLIVAGGLKLGVAPSATALATNLLATIAMLWAAARLAGRRLSTAPLVLLLGLLAVAPTHVVWSISGMETALFIALLTVGVLAYAERRWVLLGIACGGAFLTRFDGIVFWLAVLTTATYLTLHRGDRRMGRGVDWGGGARAMAAGAVLVLPWLIFAGLYFGDIVPNSVWAKLALYNRGGFDRTPPSRLLEWAFAFGLLPPLLTALLCGGGAAGLLIKPTRLALLPIWFAGYLAFFLVGKTHIHPWYVVPLHTLGILMIVLGWGRLLRMVRFWASDVARTTTRVAVAVCLLLAASVAIPRAWAEACVRQRLYEHAHAELGQFLRDRSQPGDVVYAWDIGYIGYLSGRPILDFVGIVSPEVMAANAERDFVRVLREHRPDWAVVGLYGQASQPIRSSPWFAAHYKEAYANEVPGVAHWPRDDARRLHTYRPEYVIYQRRGAAPTAAVVKDDHRD